MRRSSKLVPLNLLKTKLLAVPEVRRAYEAVAPEYAIARAVIAARTARGLTQEQLARRMRTSQSFVARLESGTVLPTMRTLLKVAKATDSRPKLSFERW